VAPGRKDVARESIGSWLRAAPEGVRARAVVRVNDAASGAFSDDLAMLAAVNARWAMLPKAEETWQVVAMRNAAPQCGVLALIESARALAAANRIALTRGVQRLVFGTLDFALDLDIPPEPAGLLHAAACIAVASRAAGLPAPVAGVTPDIGDEERLLADLAWARGLGFGAKLCIHPRQVAAVHDALRPDEAELAWAARVIAAAAAAEGAAVQVDGRMVDKPVLRRAELLLARSGR
jgi:citrate lyase subunit beta/citryl-CoA lyase